MPTTPTALELLHEDVRKILVILQGTHDENGLHHPGLAQRVGALEQVRERVAQILYATIAAVAAAFALTWARLNGQPGH